MNNISFKEYKTIGLSPAMSKKLALGRKLYKLILLIEVIRLRLMLTTPLNLVDLNKINEQRYFFLANIRKAGEIYFVEDHGKGNWETINEGDYNIIESMAKTKDILVIIRFQTHNKNGQSHKKLYYNYLYKINPSGRWLWIA